MLSEIYLLWQALDRAGSEIPREHPRVKNPGRTTGPCLRVRLDKKGKVAGVELVTNDEWPGLWTVMEGNQNSFPVVRIKQPILELKRNSDVWGRLGFDKEGKRKKPADGVVRLSALADALKNIPQRVSNKSGQDWQRLRKKADELFQYEKDDEGEFAALREFAKRFQEAATEPKALLGEIAAKGLQNAQAARLDAIDTVELLLVGKGPPNDSGKQALATVQIAFDIDDDHSFRRRLYSAEIRQRVKFILPIRQNDKEKAPNSEEEHPGRDCAFTGKTRLQTTPFPKVKLPVLNKEFPLVSMFSDAGCNKRYGLTDSMIVPVAEEAALRMQDALTWVVHPDRRGKTWRGVANGKFETTQGRKKETFDLLIVYVDGKPNINANVADIFGTDEGDEQKQFEVDAAAVCSALDGIAKEQPGSKLNIFLLRKASEGQAHVAVAESPSVEDVLRAARWWQRAGANVPDVTLLLPGQRADRAIQGRPHVPYPDQVVRLLSEQWVVNGLRSNKSQATGLGEVLDLMLRKTGKWELIAHRMLDLTVLRLGSLLLGVFGAMHTNDSQRWGKYPTRSREIALRAVSTLGILLNAIDREKETYMSGTAFLVGRLLSLSDTLHREYCEHVRDNNIPPQLIGNALMPVAADNPRGAVDRLRERMMIYKAWAERETGEKVALAKWSVSQMGQVCQQLSELALPVTTDEAFRAELFLGYMARPVSEKN
jgi:hypothetical protein